MVHIILKSIHENDFLTPFVGIYVEGKVSFSLLRQILQN